MANIFQTSYNPFVSDITLSVNQNKFLVQQVINQLDKFYKHIDIRRMVLNAFTGSGKTTVSIKALIPEFIRTFYPQKRVIGFMAPRKEVVKGAYRKAYEALDNTTVNGAKIRVYYQKDLDLLQEKLAEGKKASLDGDIIIIFMTAQYFNSNYNFLSTSGVLDLMIVDEAHIMFGTIDEEDTKADKGQRIKDFVAVTLEKLGNLTDTAVLFLTATPTNSQQMDTLLGKVNNVYLDPMPRDVLTTPFYDMIPYIDNEDTLFKGLDYFHLQCQRIGELMQKIDATTWDEAVKNFIPMYPALMARIGRRGATNGLDFDIYIKQIRKICKMYGFKLFISTSEGKEFDGDIIADMDEGVVRGSKEHDKPIVMVVIDSGYAGVDFVKINNIIIGRDPSGIIHNNYSQTAGRAARLKFGFVNHAHAAESIRSYQMSNEQKRLLAEYYIEHSSSIVHVPVDSKLLNGDVKQFIETDTFRKPDGAAFILKNVFKGGPIPGLHLVTSTTVQDDIYKQYKKDYCQACKTGKDGYTNCFHAAWEGFESIMGCSISEGEMKVLWPLCLHVHHIDGYHFNNDPKNLMTICPNVHGLVTNHNQDYKNRYPELHEALKKIANKKGVTMPKTIAFV
jgi:superfamily II DNA or RNA helicase